MSSHEIICVGNHTSLDQPSVTGEHRILVGTGCICNVPVRATIREHIDYLVKSGNQLNAAIVITLTRDGHDICEGIMGNETMFNAFKKDWEKHVIREEAFIIKSQGPKTSSVKRSVRMGN
jgi:hypothetical protein